MARNAGDEDDQIEALDRFSGVVGRIYDAALDPARWPSALAAAIDLIGGERGLFHTPFLRPDQGRIAFAHRIDETFLQQYTAHFQPHDVWNAAITEGKFREGEVATDHELVPRKHLLASEFFTGLLQHTDIAYACFAMIFGLDSAHGPCTTLSVFRGFGAKAFGAREKRMLARVMPHNSRAIGIHYRLLDAELRVAATLSALDRLEGGVVLLDGSGAVLHVNQAAWKVLADDDGLRLRESPRGPKRLSAAQTGAQTALDDAIRSCGLSFRAEVPHFSKVVAVPRPSGRAPYVLHFSALPEANDFGAGASRPRAIVFIGNPAQPVAVPSELLKQFYRLTAAELRLVDRIVAGDSVAEAATASGVSANTVKTHLQRIYDKTGTRSRAKLIHLVLSLAPPVTSG